VALSNTVFADSAKEQQINGTVVECNDHVLTIEDNKKEEHTFRNGFRTQQYKPEIGDKVTVHCAIALHQAPWADKVGKIEKGAKKD
jgi:hypothetical protein